MDVRDGYRQKLIKHWPNNRTEFSSSIIPAINTYLPGGTLVTILNHWISRVLSKETDPTKMGWWSCVHLKGKKDRIVSIYSAYRVPQDSLPGPITVYAQ